MPELEEITWEIKPSQKRHKIQNILVLIAIPISFITIYSFGVTAPLIFTQDQNLEEYLELFSKPLLYLLTIFLSVITYFFLNKYLLYSTKTYGINTEGITLSIKGTKKNYLWKDFDFFYDFSNNEIINDKKVIYLKKKASIYKTFVVLYINNQDFLKIATFIKKHLIEKPCDKLVDLGLVFYEGK